ncbi:MAG: hypothetical protein AAB553_03245 [Patescibacteria group bacterium]
MAARIKKYLTESPKKGSVSEDYFHRMLSPQAIKRSKPYHNEEEENLKNFLTKTPEARRMNFIAVGAGELWYLKYGLKYANKYISIEPLTKIFLNDSIEYLAKQMKNIILIEKMFGDVKKDEIPEGNSLYVFLFNILAYIENPIPAINKLLREGDILFISAWNTKKRAKVVRKRYFNYLNKFEKQVVIDPEESVGLCYLDHFLFESLKYYKRHKRMTGKITDILIIYT